MEDGLIMEYDEIDRQIKQIDCAMLKLNEEAMGLKLVGKLLNQQPETREVYITLSMMGTEINKLLSDKILLGKKISDLIIRRKKY